ncbi:MAG TPA: hypothetical protein VG323_09865 [Thermoanaerobaculia bacterium]|nr:hypothetical protein [Thermoanaerobaculia bacterium]
MRRMIVLFLLLATVSAFAAPKSVAPPAIPHAVAMFMASLSADGKTKVTYAATARGTYFFFEESGGVTVYSFDGDGYRKAEFLKGYTLSKALKKYSGSKPATSSAK